MSDEPTSGEARATEAIVAAARAHERDRYLSALLAPSAMRGDLIALAAFVGEVARIPVFVSEPMIGEIRLQWWRDTISNAEAGVLSGNPIADAFSRTLRANGLSAGLVQGLIDAQVLALYPDPPRDLLALQQHLTKSEGAAFELAGRIVKGAPLDGAEAQYCRDAGVAYGFARIATEFAAVNAQGRTLLPADWLSDASLTLADLSGTEHEDAVTTLVHRLTDEAVTRAHKLKTANGRTRAVLSACRAVAMVPPYVSAVRRGGASITREAADVLPLTRVWRIWRGW